MAWMQPKELQIIASVKLVRHLVHATELKVLEAFRDISDKDLLDHSRLRLQVQQTFNNNDDDDNDDDNCGHDDYNDYDISAKEHLLFKNASHQVLEILTKLSTWWYEIPGCRVKIGHLLREFLDFHTEVHPHHDLNFPRHFTRLMLKLLLLDDVFIDRDYGDKDRQCVIPFAWEPFVKGVISKLNPLSITELKLYGGMYPSIVESILYSSLHITSLSLSHINITDELILEISYTCPCLQRLFIMHSYPWQVISMDVFCTAFFSGATSEELVECMNIDDEYKIKVTFVHLTEIELCYGHIDIARRYQLYLLYYYKHLTSICSDWRTNLFEEGYQTHTSNIVIPIILKGNSLYLECLFLDGTTLFKQEPESVRHLAWSCPLIKDFKIDCNIRGCGAPGRAMVVAGRRLGLLAKETQMLNSIHINVSEMDRITQAVVMPLFEARGNSITSLTVEASSFGEKININTLCQFLKMCPQLTKLGIRVWSRSMIEGIDDQQPLVDLPNITKLQEISLHEEGPGDETGSLVDQRQISRWLWLLKSMLSVSKDINILSISVCDALSPLIDELVCSAQCIHIHVKDGYEWQPSLQQLYKLINRQPNLKHIMLEEILGENYWRVRRHYAHTGLKVHWGNLAGWPRS